MTTTFAPTTGLFDAEQLYSSTPRALVCEPENYVSLGEDLQTITIRAASALYDYMRPVYQQALIRAKTYARLKALSTIWIRDTAHFSGPLELERHPAFQVICEIGWDGITYMLSHIEDAPHHWLLALARITGENPIKPTSRGRVKKMIEDWVEWGRERGLG